MRKWTRLAPEDLPSERLAASITRRASKQAYFTIRFLADRDRVANAFRAYAYFRWLDDRLDHGATPRPVRLALVDRQRTLIASCYRGEPLGEVSPEERMLVDLVRGDAGASAGLRAYIDNMLAVMAFDARRRGRPVRAVELAGYTRRLAVAVTEALHYFIGHGQVAPLGEWRYAAATAAHIVHMLRDANEDAAAGYFNVPAELDPGAWPIELGSEAYRAWVRDRVRQARALFLVGRTYWRGVGSLRCRIAGYAYISRSEWVLDAIERDGFRLRPAYSGRKHLGNVLRIAGLATLSGLSRRPSRTHSPVISAH